MTDFSSIYGPDVSAFSNPTPKSVSMLLRPAIELYPEDSIGRFLHLVRQCGSREIPVQSHGKLVGSISQTILFELLRTANSWDDCDAINQPVSDFMTVPSAIASADMSLETIVEIGRASNILEIPVVDFENYLLGTISLSDILAPDYNPHYPSNVGGMATPFGVYLTNGNVRGGVNDLAIIASGAAMGCLLLISGAIVKGLAHLAAPILHLPSISILDLDDVPPPGHVMQGFISILLKLAIFFIFVLLLRFSRISGFHAAEHQTVHAMERGEPLIPEIVNRMPRPHPRCGTNIMAASILFFTLLQTFQYVPGLNEIGILPAGLFTWYNWRRFGTFLQQWFTTRPASPKQLLSGINAAAELQAVYMRVPPSRIRPLRKIWLMGIVQSATGLILVTGLASYIESIWTVHAR